MIRTSAQRFSETIMLRQYKPGYSGTGTSNVLSVTETMQ